MARVAVATSGGLDSTALLHCTVAQARSLGVQVIALHVHHGLMPQADVWLDQVRRQALRWGAGFDARRLEGSPPAGDSVEAWARDGRYTALTEMAHAQDCGLVLLAHHRRDQAETWLLQALRGAGEAGLSAMPGQAERHGLRWCRPWLDQSRDAIESYARRYRLRWVDDPSNADARFARSRLRKDLWPALRQAFPEAEAALALSARHAQSAATLAREVALDDLGRMSEARGLHLPTWRELGPGRQRNALRGWLHGLLGAFPPYTLVDRLMSELPAARGGRWPTPGGTLRLHRGWLSCETALLPSEVPPVEDQRADLSAPGRQHLPAWGGDLVVSRCAEHGVPPALLRQVLIHPRRGGEQFRLAPRATARSLKKQFQALACPAWERSGPLVSSHEGRLLFAPHLGMDASGWALPGQPQLRLDWVPATADSTPASTAPGQLPS
jgi:tRNA(Ile)-lysidine synthase